MTQKRTDRILDLLDATLQSTTPSQHGMPIGNPDLCVGCTMAPPVEGRSWCEACLPDKDDDAPPRWADEQNVFAWDALMEAAGFHHDEAPPDAIGAVQIDAMIGGEIQALAFVAVDEDHQPVGLGLNVELILGSPDCFAMLAALDETFTRLFGSGAFAGGEEDES